jgi:hypothetical protein
VWIVFDFVCQQRLSQCQIATTLAMYFAPARDCAGNRHLLVAQALPRKLDTTKKADHFTDCSVLLMPGCSRLLLAAVPQTCPPADKRLPSSTYSQSKALQLALWTISAALLPPTHAYDGVLDLPGRTASQMDLSSHMNCPAEQTLVLDTDVCRPRITCRVPDPYNRFQYRLYGHPGYRADQL